MQFVFKPPCDIRFTQSSIKASFMDGRTLEETACQLARSEIQKRDVTMVKVVNHEGSWYSLDNRRLAVFRLLQFVGKIRCIKAEVVEKDLREWNKKFDTKTGGTTIVVRGTQHVVGLSISTTTFPLERIRQASMTSSSVQLQRCAYGLPAILQEMDSDDEDNELRSIPQPDHVRNRASRASYCARPEWEGAHKLVARGSYTEGARIGDACVVKWFKSGQVYSSADFDDDVRAINEATRIVSHFNATLQPTRRVYVNEAEVWRRETSDCVGYAALLVEPLIHGTYQRFNSNTGFQIEGCDLMAALSHFSYHFTQGQAVLCDLQGGRYDDCYVLTDPVILSPSRKYGVTDLGQMGIDHFFSQHRCTSCCKESWRRPATARHIFEVREGSSMIANGLIHYGSKRVRSGSQRAGLAEIHEREPEREPKEEQPAVPAIFFFALVVLFFAFMMGGAGAESRY
mmetsp:Transcript_37900/g.80533  ORF Transcript_37900/g.80533 Transcript_37900/m.80533 type:complete len:456 (+) Transcript_37900:106-1473(+)